MSKLVELVYCFPKKVVLDGLVGGEAEELNQWQCWMRVLHIRRVSCRGGYGVWFGW